MADCTRQPLSYYPRLDHPVRCLYCDQPIPAGHPIDFAYIVDRDGRTFSSYSNMVHPACNR